MGSAMNWSSLMLTNACTASWYAWIRASGSWVDGGVEGAIYRGVEHCDGVIDDEYVVDDSQ